MLSRGVISPGVRRGGTYADMGILWRGYMVNIFTAGASLGIFVDVAKTI